MLKGELRHKHMHERQARTTALTKNEPPLNNVGITKHGDGDLKSNTGSKKDAEQPIHEVSCLVDKRGMDRMDLREGETS